MPYTETDPRLPFAPGRTPHARKASYDGAVEAQRQASRKLAQLQDWYEARGDYGATDAETQVQTGWLFSSICSLRNNLVKRGLVEDSDLFRPSPCNPKRGIVVWRRVR